MPLKTEEQESHAAPSMTEKLYERMTCLYSTCQLLVDADNETNLLAIG
jgi:hypothetical protein